MNPILVVEDEKDIAELVEYHLRESGFPVIVASDGASALEKAKKSNPTLVILDLMLPDMDGKDICRTLKSNPHTRGIPVLMLTAKAEEIDRIVGFELGADDYVTKPFSPRELVLRVKAILRKRERIRKKRGSSRLRTSSSTSTDTRSRFRRRSFNSLPSSLSFSSSFVSGEAGSKPVNIS